jgi:hypothetical protein
MQGKQISMKKIRFFIISGGFLLPLAIGLLFALFHPSHILTDLFNVFFLAGILAGFFNVIPFILLAILIRNHPGTKHIPELGMIVAVASASIFFNAIFFIDLASDSPSSTGGLIFLVLPVHVSIAIPLGYLCGLIIQFVLNKYRLKNRGEKSG